MSTMFSQREDVKATQDLKDLFVDFKKSTVQAVRDDLAEGMEGLKQSSDGERKATTDHVVQAMEKILAPIQPLMEKMVDTLGRMVSLMVMENQCDDSSGAGFEVIDDDDYAEKRPSSQSSS